MHFLQKQSHYFSNDPRNRNNIINTIIMHNNRKILFIKALSHRQEIRKSLLSSVIGKQNQLVTRNFLPQVSCKIRKDFLQIYKEIQAISCWIMSLVILQIETESIYSCKFFPEKFPPFFEIAFQSLSKHVTRLTYVYD